MLLVAVPGAPSSSIVTYILVVRPGAPSSVLAPRFAAGGCYNFKLLLYRGTTGNCALAVLALSAHARGRDDANFEGHRSDVDFTKAIDQSCWPSQTSSPVFYDLSWQERHWETRHGDKVLRPLTSSHFLGPKTTSLREPRSCT